MGQLRIPTGSDRKSQLYLSSLTIPATHNSHATFENVSQFGYKRARVADYQRYEVQEQLEMGVRSLDFRLGGDAKLRHGKSILNGGLQDVLRVMSIIFDDHPDETIMFQAKWDS